MLVLDLNSNQGHNMFIHDGSRSDRIVLGIQIKGVNGPIWSGLMQVWSLHVHLSILYCAFGLEERGAAWLGEDGVDRASHLESEPLRPWHCAVPSQERLGRARVLELSFH
eukprot:TRINITY_DN17456_c0_g1_i1.p1 TRINITY_DN17456_c0_g1~~TRINITY_DN17456_c0_g1_i1.p1  ORF type:complete len:110 (+),score=11.52 TRINITY_DN17456_c0_g1_i1:863-1192(+)